MLKPYAIEIKWTVIYLFANILWTAAERLFGLHDQYIAKQWLIGNLFLLLTFAIFYLALAEKKAKSYNGKVGFQDTFISGMILTFALTITAPFIQIINWLFVSPHFFENAIRYTMSIGQYDLNEAKAHFSLGNYLMQTMIFVPMIGFFLSALVAYLLKSKVSA